MPRRSLRWSLLLLALVILFGLPFAALFGLALDAEREVWSHLWQTVLPGYVINSLQLTLLVGVGTLVLGVGSGWVMAMYDFPGRPWFEWSLLLPLAYPGYIVAMVYAELLDYAGPVQSTLRGWFGWRTPRDYWFPEIASIEGAAVVLTLVLYPYVYLLSRTAFQQQAGVLLEASRMLGFNRRRSFWNVGLPLARPAIIVGVSLVLMETLADFGTVKILAVQTFTTGIYHTWFGTSNPAGAAQLALSLLGFVVLLVAVERHSRKLQQSQSRNIIARPYPRKRPEPLKQGLAFLACGGPLFLGFLLPSALLIGWTWQAWASMRLGEFGEDVLHSLTLSAGAAVLAIVLGVFLNYGIRLNPRPILRWVLRLVSLGYAIPGPVIALGVLIPFAWMDRTWLNPLLLRWEWELTYLLSGTVLILLFAYLVRFLSLAFGTIEAGLSHVTSGMDEASRMLGRNQWQTLREIHVPLLRRSVFTAGLLVFVDVMKELPATLMLRPFNFGTLATRAFSYAAEERLQQASLWCLTIVLFGLVPLILTHFKMQPTRRDLQEPSSHRLMSIAQTSQTGT